MQASLPMATLAIDSNKWSTIQKRTSRVLQEFKTPDTRFLHISQRLLQSRCEVDSGLQDRSQFEWGDHPHNCSKRGYPDYNLWQHQRAAPCSNAALWSFGDFSEYR